MQTTVDNILNVTLLEPRQKHPTIFSRFDELQEGESLIIHNDHDPKPLYYQLMGERGDIFTWEYLEQGPQWWKIKITKRKTGEGNETLAELATKDIRYAQIFKKFGLDFCCNGHKTVSEACAEKGIDVKRLENELQHAENLQGSSRPLPYNEWSIDFLADYIVNTHHSYLRKVLPDIRAYAKKVMQVHSDRHPELVRMQELVDATAIELLEHMQKEEKDLFPYIKQMVSGKSVLNSGVLQETIHNMEKEHSLVGDNLHELRHITNNYQLPEDSCASYSLLFRMLDEMEDDVHLHIHLENNILFPKAVEFEKSKI